jgi:hypothetical protein
VENNIRALMTYKYTWEEYWECSTNSPIMPDKAIDSFVTYAHYYKTVDMTCILPSLLARYLTQENNMRGYPQLVEYERHHNSLM